MTNAPTNSRERLLEVAEALFAQQGYLATSVREIVQGAGVQPPALYYHFKNKETLLVELLQLRFDAYSNDMSARMAEATDVVSVFRIFADRALELLRSNPNSVRFIFGVLYGPQHELPTALVRKLQIRYVDILHRRVSELRPDVDPDRVTFVCVSFQGMAHALTLQSMWVGRPHVPDDVSTAIAVRCANMLDDELPIPRLASRDKL